MTDTCPTCGQFCDHRTRCECLPWCLAPYLYKKPKEQK
jgi:hypothetical protein